MPVRSIHEEPALTPEMLGAMPADEWALTDAIILRWTERMLREEGPVGTVVAPAVGRAARGLVRMLLAENLICPVSARRLAREPGASVVATLVVAFMMEGAEALRWHELAEARADLGAELEGGGETREDRGDE